MSKITELVIASLGWPSVINKRVVLRVVQAPLAGEALSAPPMLEVSDNTVAYLCGRCGVPLNRERLRGQLDAPRDPDALNAGFPTTRHAVAAPALTL